MMKQLSIIVALLLACVAGLMAQTDKNKKTPKAKPIPVYLGNQYNTGTIPSNIFRSLLIKGLNGRDSLGKMYRADGFTITYVERNLYEDAEGNPKIEADYLMEYCFGDSLNTFVRNSIAGKAKAGDTVYFDKISLISPEGQGAQGKAIKLVLTK